MLTRFQVSLLVAGGLAIMACFERREPPGADVTSPGPAVVSAGPGSSGATGADEGGPTGPVPTELVGTEQDNLPFRPDGTQLASIAWRTWAYTDTGPRRTRFGYLRAGAVVGARGPALQNDGCAGGWYRINPRGFVCIGKGATLDLNHYVVVSNAVRPERGKGMPYLYAMAREVSPHRYIKLPTLEQMVELEGDGIRQRFESWKLLAIQRGHGELLRDPPPPPVFLSEDDAIIKPYGVKEYLHFAAHSGRASPDSGFAITSTFLWQARLFGVTTELDVIALDRTMLVKPSEFCGVELGESEDLPVGFIQGHYAPRFKHSGDEFVPFDRFQHRQGVKLTGNQSVGGVQFWELRDGTWMTGGSARIIPKRTSFPSFATGSRKWIDISIKEQTLVAYSGTQAVYATLVSTGRGGLGDPEKVLATPRGTFMIHSKHVTATMDGEDDHSDSFNLQDVPFVQYFHKGYALHGTYWHDQYGQVRSHGCVNLSPVDAAWLFEWTDPVVPPGWHGRVSKDRGTVVYVRP